MQTEQWILPGEYLGVLGGGQLGRMFAQAAQKIGYKIITLEETLSSPAGQISNHHINHELHDEQALDIMAKHAKAVTVEFENVPTDSLSYLANHLPTRPNAKCVAVAQDRIKEKNRFRELNIPCVANTAIESVDDLGFIPDNFFPAILKTARLGYDGKGQMTVRSKDELSTAFHALNRVPCIIEKKIVLKQEISVILARSHHGQVVTFPVAQNIHRDGILHTTTVDFNSNKLYIQAQNYAQQLAIHLNYHGVMCAEFFIDEQDHLFINEFAPRPHNSGHYTMDACNVSQFDLQVRTTAGLPLIQPTLKMPCVMVNLLGDIWFSDQVIVQADHVSPNWAAVLALPNVYLHLYDKHEARFGRKMGHINCTGDTLEAAQVLAQKVMTLLGIVA